MEHPFFDVPNPTVIGHRGAAGHAPENTLVSFHKALELGAVVLESDLRLTADGAIVLHHDPTVDRVTDGTGAVAELSLEALRRLDAGYRFTPDDGETFPFRGRGLRIPTLAEAFEAFPGARFNLEVKVDSEALVSKAVATLEEHGRGALTLLTAGSDAAMGRLRSELARRKVDAAVGASTGDTLRFIQAALENTTPPPEPMALQVPEQFGGRPVVTEPLVRFAHAHRVAVHVWTVNDPDAMREFLDLGVNGIITDHPEHLVRLLAERNGETSRAGSPRGDKGKIKGR